MAWKFGSKQVGKPTPANIGRFTDIYSAVAAALIAWLGTVDFISSYKVKVIGSILSLGILVCQALKPFFGVQITTAKVSAEDVTAMEDPAKKDK